MKNSILKTIIAAAAGSVLSFYMIRYIETLMLLLTKQLWHQTNADITGMTTLRSGTWPEKRPFFVLRRNGNEM